MREYNQNEVKKWSWLKRQKYIESSDVLGDCEYAGLKLIEKLPIEKIKYNPLKFSNVIVLSEVLSMIDEFFLLVFYL